MGADWTPEIEYRRLFRVWAENPTQENWDAMNRAADELDAATERLIAAITADSRDEGRA